MTDATTYTISHLAWLLGGADRAVVRRWVLGWRSTIADWQRAPLLPAHQDSTGRWQVAAADVHSWLDRGASGAAVGLYRGEHALQDDADRLLTVRAVARALRVSDRTVRRATAEGRLGCIRPPGLNRQLIPVRSLHAYIDSRRRAPLHASVRGNGDRADVEPACQPK